MAVTIERAQQLLDSCKKHELEAPEEFWNTPIEELAAIYNGAGPDWLPNWGRAILSFFLCLFAAAFFIHDFEFDRSDKSKEGFIAANKRMLKNMNKILAAAFPLTKFSLWVERIRWWIKARLAYHACKKHGWSAWID